MKNQFLFILALLITLASCKKGGVDYVKGTVYEDGSNAPIAGVLITLYEDTRTQSNVIVDRVNTNSNGEYVIKYNKIPGRNYILKCEHFNFINAGDPMGIEIEKGKEANNFVLIPLAYLKIRYVKTTTNNTAIMGKVNGQFFVSPFPASPTTASQTFDSTGTEVIPVYGSRPNAINWGSVVPYVDQAPFDDNQTKASFTVPKGDTIVYTISFN